MPDPLKIRSFCLRDGKDSVLPFARRWSTMKQNLSDTQPLSGLDIFGQSPWAMRTALGLLRSRVPWVPSMKTSPRGHSFCLLICFPKMEPSSAQADFIVCCELGCCFPMLRPWVTRQKLRSSRPSVAASGLLHCWSEKGVRLWRVSHVKSCRGCTASGWQLVINCEWICGIKVHCTFESHANANFLAQKNSSKHIWTIRNETHFFGMKLDCCRSRCKGNSGSATYCSHSPRSHWSHCSYSELPETWQLGAPGVEQVVLPRDHVTTLFKEDGLLKWHHSFFCMWILD